jgi:ABC-type Fe3+-citrate transport system substrate-binding protein
MDQDYQELIETVSHQIAQTFLDHESNITQRALLLDADIAEITRQIGLETTKIVLARSRDDLVKKNNWTG